MLMFLEAHGLADDNQRSFPEAFLYVIKITHSLFVLKPGVWISCQDCRLLCAIH